MELNNLEKYYEIKIPEGTKNFLTSYNNDVIYYSEKIVKGYNLFTGKCIFKYEPKGKIELIKISYDNKYLLVQILNNDIKKSSMPFD